MVETYKDKTMIRICQLTIIILLFSAAYFSALHAEDAQPAKGLSAEADFNKQTTEELKFGIEQKHPAAYYILASKLFADGKKDEAVFWFYAGQLRYRFHLAANRNLNPSGDPALFSSFSEVIGRPLNEYAFGDIPQLVKTIDEVLKWDETHENHFTSKTAHQKEYKGIRDGLAEMRGYILENQEEIKRQRTANGLGNR
jgi:hypothetical protein